MGCDSICKPLIKLKNCFNPRTHMGCDFVDLLPLVLQIVSIHAPTWGATCNIILYLFKVFGFNPRTHMGCDKNRQQLTNLSRVSIHAPTWGATGYTFASSCHQNVSIHAPTWGATLQTQSEQKCYLVSIHAPTWGATPKDSSNS